MTDRFNTNEDLESSAIPEECIIPDCDSPVFCQVECVQTIEPFCAMHLLEHLRMWINGGSSAVGDITLTLIED